MPRRRTLTDSQVAKLAPRERPMLCWDPGVLVTTSGLPPTALRYLLPWGAPRSSSRFGIRKRPPRNALQHLGGQRESAGRYQGYPRGEGPKRRPKDV